MKHSSILRALALILALTLTIGSASASTVKAGETISDTSKWINSDVIGAIDESTVVSVKDDFHTAVNRDWILYAEDHSGAFARSADLLTQRKLDIVMGKAPVDPANADAIGLSSECLAHDLKLVQIFTSLAGEWDQRNALGVEPARPYLEAVQSIKTMEELTAFITNESGMNISGFSLVDLTVAADAQTHLMQAVTIAPSKSFILPSRDQYLYMDESGRDSRFLIDEASHYLLGRLGYEDKEISDMLVKAFRFEGRMAEWIAPTTTQQTLKYLTSAQAYAPAEAAELVGAYPLMAQLEALGATDTPVMVYETTYLRRLDALYQPRYLEEIKAVITMHLVMDLMSMLDEAAYNKMEELILTVYPEHAETIPTLDITNLDAYLEEEEQDEAKEQAQFVFDNYLSVYLPEPMDQIYVAAYCTPEQKAEIRGMIDKTLDFYRTMIRDVDWLSEEARAATVDKLDNMIVRCVYPDSFTDYTSLTFNGYRDEVPGTLPQAVAAIREFNRRQLFATAGQPVDRNAWRMLDEFTSTTVCNAFYHSLENSINIMAGILTEEMLDPSFTYEQKLGTIGVVIGHEITHAFDTNGYQFDKNGINNPWWSTADVEAFDLRASRLVKFYNAVPPYPGAMLYNGSAVSGEAIADMGGMKCMLNIAREIPDFDYDAFFRAFSGMWRAQYSLSVEKQLAAQDVHPLGFLRTNITVQQFDEFHQTYDLQPGDGMYLAPENRISVW